MNGIAWLSASLRLFCPGSGSNFGLSSIIDSFGTDKNVRPCRVCPLNRSHLAPGLTTGDMPTLGQNYVELLDQALALTQLMETVGGLIKHSLKSKIKSCQQRFCGNYVLGMQLKDENANLIFGQQMALGLFCSQAQIDLHFEKRSIDYPQWS